MVHARYDESDKAELHSHDYFRYGLLSLTYGVLATLDLEPSTCSGFDQRCDLLEGSPVRSGRAELHRDHVGIVDGLYGRRHSHQRAHEEQRDGLHLTLVFGNTFAQKILLLLLLLRETLHILMDNNADGREIVEALDGLVDERSVDLGSRCGSENRN